jgi:hypothetical protein
MIDEFLFTRLPNWTLAKSTKKNLKKRRKMPEKAGQNSKRLMVNKPLQKQAQDEGGCRTKKELVSSAEEQRSNHE